MSISIYHHLAAIQGLIVQAAADGEMNIQDIVHWMYIRTAVLAYMESGDTGEKDRQRRLNEAARLLPPAAD